MDTVHEEKFREVVVDILKTSIKNVICIDDEFSGFYGLEEPNEYESGLYNGFIENTNSYVTMVKFKDVGEVLKLIRNSEMLVLDWELDQKSTGDKFCKTLEILEHINNMDCSFVCIYTQNSELLSIYNFIDNYFMDRAREEIEQDKNLLKTYIGDLHQFNSSIESALHMGNEDDLKDKVVEWINKNADDMKELSKEGVNKKDIIKKVKQIYLYERYNIMKNSSKSVKIQRIFKQSKLVALNMDGKLLVVMNKKNEVHPIQGLSVKPQEVFETFAKMVYEAPNSVFNVVWLYYRNLLHSSIAQNNTFLNNIEDNTLFYYYKLMKEKSDDENNSFENTLLDHFKEELISKICIQDYSLDKRLVDYIEVQETDEPEQSEYFKFNAFYSMNKGVTSSERKIAFGDLFLIKEEVVKGEHTSSFNDVKNRVVLCITAHCDCLHSTQTKKIKGSYSFALGESTTNKVSLVSPEQDTYGMFDFIEIKDECKAVKWDNYLIKIFLSDEFAKVKVGKSIEGYYKDCKISMEYLGSLRESYAQRIANKLYSFSNRIGINYLSNDKVKSKVNCENCEHTFEEKIE